MKKKSSLQITFFLVFFFSFLFAQAQDVLLVDIGSTVSDSPWNNVLTPSTGEVQNMRKSDGVLSGYGVKVFDAFSAVTTSGTTNPDANLGFPATATEDSFYGNVTEVGGETEPTGGLEFYNLKPEKEYTFTIFASRDANNNRETKYLLEGATDETRLLNPTANTSEVVTATLKPDANGSIHLTASPGPNNNTDEGYFYLGCLTISYEHEEPVDAGPCPIVILGSSTAAGFGPANPADAWVPRYTEFLSENVQYPVTNLALGGFTTYHVLPTGTPIPADVNIEIDETRNVTKALTLNPFAIIINLPSNDVTSGFSVDDQMANYDIIVQEALNQGVKVWVCTPQPLNNVSADKTAALIELRERIIEKYSAFVIDFWTGLATDDGHLKEEYNSDDTHLTALGHQLLYEKVVDKRIINLSPCSPRMMGNLPPETAWGVPAVPSDIPMPDYLQSQTDDDYGIKFTRLVDSTVFCNAYGDALPHSSQNHQYSKVQAWNADGTHLFFGSVFLLNGNDYTIDKIVQVGGDARWSNTEPNIRYNCSGNQLRKTDVIATPVETEVIHTFGDYDQIAIGPWEGNLSIDDHYVVIANVIDDDWGNKASIYDIWTDQVLGTFEGNFDWATISPFGQYVVVSNNNTGHTEVYNLAFEYQYDLINSQEHGDFAVNVNGEEVFVQVIPLSMIRLSDAHFTDLLPATDATSGTCGYDVHNPHIAGHVSGRNLDLPGWAYVSASIEECANGEGYEWDSEIFAVKLDESALGTVRSFGHSRGLRFNGNTSPIATVNNSGEKVLFFSNWDRHGQGLHEGENQYRHMTFMAENANQPLPVEWVDWAAQRVGNQVAMWWQTLSEKNNKGFFVQRSQDGHSWVDLGFVKGIGNSEGMAEYQFRDSTPLTGNNYYRLQQVDFDGQINNSSVISVYFSSRQMDFYPNPATETIYINSSGKKIDKVLIFNGLGQAVLTSLAGKNTIDISHLPKGLYWVFAQADNLILREKLVVE